jgi:serine/threonine protein kinase
MDFDRPGPPAPDLTGSGSRVGSPWFMAPSRLAAACGPAADVFSLGSLAVYAAAGHPPFGTGGAVAALQPGAQRATGPDCARRTCTQIERCLAKDPRCGRGRADRERLP